MPLTSASWAEACKNSTTIKRGKPEKKHPPEDKVKAVTEAIKSYETADKNWKEGKPDGTYTKVTGALDELETKRKALFNELDAKDTHCEDMFEWLRSAVMKGIPTAKQEAEKHNKAVLLQQQLAKAASQDEAIYEALWDVYEGQQKKLAATPSRAEFKTAQQQLKKLKAQGEKCQQDTLLSTKYAKLLPGIQKEIERVEGLEQKYEKVIDDAIDLRQKLITQFEEVETVATRAKAQLEAFESTIKTSTDTEKIKKTAAGAAMVYKGTVAKIDEVHKHLLPGTVVRNTTDLKDAKIHTDDSSRDVAPVTSGLFTVDKSLLELKNEIGTLTTTIAQTAAAKVKEEMEAKAKAEAQAKAKPQAQWVRGAGTGKPPK
jgi:hypothetical protein